MNLEVNGDSGFLRLATLMETMRRYFLYVPKLIPRLTTNDASRAKWIGQNGPGARALGNYVLDSGGNCSSECILVVVVCVRRRGLSRLNICHYTNITRNSSFFLPPCFPKVWNHRIMTKVKVVLNKA